MADDRQDGDAHIVPTAIDLHEPKFPNVNGSASDSSRSDLRTAAVKNDQVVKPLAKEEMTDLPQNELKEPRRSFDTRMSRIQTDITPDRRQPPLRKSVSERPRQKPQTNTKHSPLGKRIHATRKRPNALTKRPTLTFDPYSSESSSSSEEDEPLQTAKLEEYAQNARKEEAKKKRELSRGPFSRFKIAHDEFSTKGKVSKRDGRLKLRINETVNSGYFAKTLGAGLKKHLRGRDVEKEENVEDQTEKIAPEEDDMEDPAKRVRLNIVIIVIGSRGDIQPFLKIGKILKEDYGHRVRIATHPAFKKFVEEDSGLEFFSVGGDPSELMAFMVKNPGLIPSVDTIKEGEIGKRRAAMYEMFQGMWRACINSTDDEDDYANLKMMGTKTPFIADAIIANPPSFAPPHIAERLGIPLHMMFTFPYTPTTQFPHPLANIKSSNVDAGYTNFMSYPLVEMMTWQGLGDLINRFRAKTLWLDEVSTLWAPGQLYRLKVPYTYMWSPGLVPKPKDWGPEIDISGFVFLDLASSFKPPEDLVKFLDNGEPPVYIGFGSIVVDDPNKFTELIFEAVKLAGVRALVSKGWGGFGSNRDAPDNIYMLENTPHDWLFPRVSAVVHHGGAGTTAIGLKCARPTMIVPFFGDQPFWGAMVAKAKAGAHECIPYKKLTAERLAEGIKQCLTDEARKNVKEIADSIAKEGDGALNAVRSFHRSLPLRGENNMRCQILPTHCASWKLKNTNLRLCPLAAELLVEWKKIRWNELRLLRNYEWNDFGGPGEPVTGMWGALIGTVDGVVSGVGLVPLNMARSVKRREKYYRKSYKLSRKKKHAKERLAKANAQNIMGGGVPNGPIIEDSQSGVKHQDTNLSNISVPEDWLAEEFAKEARHGFVKTGNAILKSPMYFTLAIAQGFHNAPRLYGDETVRRPPRITGFHSGLRAGRDEFVYGVADGVTGVWRLPIKGAKEGGVLGGLRGFGMGIGGLVLKDIAAFIGPPAYFMKGLNEESLKKHQPTNYIRRARILQGQTELAALGPDTPHSLRKLSSARTSDTDDGKDAMKRQEIEIEVSKKWEALQVQLAKERLEHHSGVRAALFGKHKGKDGKIVDRKVKMSSRPSSRGTSRSRPRSADSKEHLKPVASAPIQQAQQFNEEVPEQGVKKRGTAPSKAMDWKEKSRRKTRLDKPAHHVKQDAVAEGKGQKQNIPNIFTDEQGTPANGSAKESGPLPEDGFDGRKRATSDTTDWATIKKDVVDDNERDVVDDNERDISHVA
jgi:UDP:flavonoid glycosyltransferase YjiC (YdhE family)